MRQIKYHPTIFDLLYHSTILKTTKNKDGNINFETNFGNIKEFFTRNNKLSDSDLNAIKAYNAEFTRLSNNVKASTTNVSSHIIAQKAANKTMENASRKARDIVKNANNSTVSLKNLTSSSKAAALGMKSLSIAGNMLVSMAISFGISELIQGIDYLINYEEKQKEAFENAKTATEESARSIQDLKSKMSDTSSKAQDLSSEYAKLVQGVDPFTNENKKLSTEQYEKFLDVNNQLAELFPSMTKSYDENGNAILGLIGDIDTVTASIQRLVKQQNNFSKADIRKHLDEYVNGTDDSDGIFKALEGYKKDVKDAENDLNSLKDIYDGMMANTGGIYFGMDDRAWNDYLDDAKNKLGQEAYDALYHATVYGDGFSGSKTYTIDFSQLQLDETTKGKITESYNTFYQDLSSTLEIKKSELETKNHEMSDMMMLWVEELDLYKNSDNESFQKLIELMVGSIQWSDLKIEEGNLDEAKQFIQQSILNPLSIACKDPNTKLEILYAVNSLFTLDFSNMSYKDASEKIKNFISIIRDTINKNLPKEQQKSDTDFYNMFGLGDYQNISDKMSNSLSDIASKGSEDYKRLETYTEGFTQKQVEAWLTATNGAKNADEAIRNYEKTLNASKNTLPKSFLKAWDSIGTSGDAEKDNAALEAKEKLLELAEAGKLTEAAFRNSSISNDFLNQTKLSAEEATQKINELVSSADQLASIKTGISSISTILKEKKENQSSQKTRKKGISADTLAGMPEDIKKQKKEYEHFVDVLGDGTSQMDDCRKAANKLAAAYVNSGNFLANLTDENQDYYKSVLDEMGVENAAEVINYALGKQKVSTKIATIDLTTATKKEVDELGNYITSLDGSSTALGYYALQQQIANNNALDTSNSIDNLILLAKQCGITGEAIALMTSLAEDAKEVENYLENGGKNDKHAGDVISNIDYANRVQKKKKRLKKLLSQGAKLTIDEDGPKSESGNESNNKSPKSKTTQQFDWINRSLDRLSSKLDLVKAKYDNLFNHKKAKDSDSLLKLRNKNLDKQYKLLKKTAGYQEKAQKKYTNKANSVRISKNKKEDASIKKAVRQGRINSKSMKKLIADYGEQKAEKIQKYQDWYDKAREVEKSKITTQTAQRENRIQKYQGIVDNADEKRTLAQAGKENATTAKAKNEYIEKEKESIETSYDYQIRIADLKRDSLEADRLIAEKAKEIRDLDIERHQNLANEYQSTLDQYGAEKELAAKASEKNNLIESEKAKTKELYAEKIAIAELEGSVSEQKQLQAELDKQLRDFTVEQHQNIADEYQAELDRSSAEKENVKTAREKNAIVDREKELTRQLYAEKIKIAECEGSIAEKQQLQEEFTRQMVVLEKEKFDNISHYYETLMRLESNAYTDLNNASEELEARGLFVSGKMYDSQIAINNDKKKMYEEELLSLNAQLHSIEKETDEWYDAMDAIQSCENGIAELTKDTQALAEASRKVSFELSEKIISRYDLISSEYDLLIEFMSGKNHTDDKTGNFTKEGAATLGAYYAKLLLAKNELETFQKSMSDMYDKLQSGEEGYTDQKAWDEYYGYMDKLFQLEKDYYGLQQDIAGQMEKRYAAELDCLQDIINKRKELLQTEKDEYDYRRTIEEKTKNIGVLAKQIHALNGDDSEAAKTKIQQLRVSLDDAQKDLQDTEYDRWLSDQQTILDDLYNTFHDFIDNKLNDTNALFNEALIYLKDKNIGSEISDVLNSYANTYSHTYSPDLMNISTALSKEGDIVKAITDVSATISEKYQNQLKATQDAGSVIRLISKIGQVDYDGDGRKRLVAAEQAYNSLSPEAKSIVDTTSVNGLSTLQQKQSEWSGLVEARKQETAKAEQAAAQQRLDAENEKKREAFKDLIRRTYLADAHTYANTSGRAVLNKNLETLLKVNGLYREDNYPLSEAGVRSIMTQLGFSRPENQDMDYMYQYMKNIGFSDGGIAQTIQNVPGLNGDHGWATLTKGEAVLTPQQAKDFKILAQNLNVLNPAANMLQHLSGPNGSAAGHTNSTTIGDVHVTVDLPNVTNYEEFKQKMQSDPKIEQMFKSMIWDKGSLSKYRINVR